ncbi:MAG: GNAT family N-acetyltransferase, partial [Actinomycetota bacterium]
MTIELVVPSDAHLPSYIAALERRWSPNTTRPEVADEQLVAIAEDPERFLAGMDDPDGLLPPVVLPDGSSRHRLPGFTRWLWDGEHCGSINLRWQPGRTDLPPWVLG